VSREREGTVGIDITEKRVKSIEWRGKGNRTQSLSGKEKALSPWERKEKRGSA
jgi:Tfp pilus assembly PilM family ATPase